MSLDQVRDLVAADMQAVNELIQERLRSDVLLINQLSLYIINSGGKRLRPLLVLLAAHAGGYGGRHHHELAAIVEFIHTATLLHDDVVDASDLRRGRETANAIWGNEASVLVGDFLYSRAFEMMVEVGSMRIMEIMAQTTNTIAEGEVMQLLNCHDPDTTEAHYLEVIRCKTAKLFEAAARIGAVLGEQPPAIEEAMAAYGMHLGTAFQLIDDVLDYSADAAETGKNIGDDLAEGKPTLPLSSERARPNRSRWYARPSNRAAATTSTPFKRPLNRLGPSRTLRNPRDRQPIGPCRRSSRCPRLPTGTPCTPSRNFQSAERIDFGV